ncbi:hypothetical protein Vadar_019722 [Vaccinium darrowii]|uniref:Uncharacterized protein n=1 Tax=Vaccinium darrowii TaxID=229202 RepID=A0ACB7Y7U7_9ERIC|nr:hypothetical protein Vadar_019722 [Vaccinium darrowii]
MIIPPGYLFRPSDEEILVFYLGRKIKGLPLPCDVFIERDIYGVGPWQIFSDQDLWEICKNGMKTEGCSPVGGAGVGVVWCFGFLLLLSYIGFPLLVFSAAAVFSVGCSYVDPIVSCCCCCCCVAFLVSSLIAGLACFIAVAVLLVSGLVPKPGKRIRTKFVPATEGVPFSEELLEVEKQGENSPMHSDMVDGDFEELDSLISLLESEEQPSLGFDCDAYGTNSLSAEVVTSGHVLASSAPVALDTSQDMVAGYFEEQVSLLESEEQPSFNLDYDAFGYNPLTPEDTSHDYGEEVLTYLMEPYLPYQENLWSGEPNYFGVGLLT